MTMALYPGCNRKDHMEDCMLRLLLRNYIFWSWCGLNLIDLFGRRRKKDTALCKISVRMRMITVAKHFTETVPSLSKIYHEQHFSNTSCRGVITLFLHLILLYHTMPILVILLLRIKGDCGTVSWCHQM